MHIDQLDISDILLLVPTKHADARGFFSETFRADVATEYGLKAPFLQDNHVHSKQKGVLRGLHFQIPPRAQGKLVRCVRGAILDVAVDIRVGSPSYGQHVAVELSADNWKQLWIPPGFAHGYVTLLNDCEVIYKVTEYYAPAHDRGIIWNDPALQIDWQVPEAEITVSPKDSRLPKLAELDPTFTFERWK
jgi:dTDP-4-dehydrorhamnose 3,5-epimerase